MGLSASVDGVLLTYSTTNKAEITKVNHYLFGRVCTIKRGDKLVRYYYPGILEQRKYTRLTNGCYFIADEEIGFDKHMLHLVQPFACSLDINGSVFQTGKDHWKGKLDNIQR